MSDLADSPGGMDRQALNSCLRQLGLDEGNVCLVHASLSQLGWVNGGAETVVDALLDAVAPSGTVLFPTLTGSEKDGPEYPPSIDVSTTPCWTGAIPEAGRRRVDTVRSLHPTHSVAALGAEANRWVAGHDAGTSPCDETSPFFRLIQEDGFILLLGGVTQKSNTTLHCLEEMAGVPYHLQPEMTDGIVVNRDGKRLRVRNRLHLWGRERDFLKIDSVLDARGARQVGRVGASLAQLIPARLLADILMPLLQEDPLFLLTRDAKRAFVTAHSC